MIEEKAREIVAKLKNSELLWLETQGLKDKLIADFLGETFTLLFEAIGELINDDPYFGKVLTVSLAARIEEMESRGEAFNG
jgi:hypothetical protein